jgi:subtilisin-like proprotein convertase family protein
VDNDGYASYERVIAVAACNDRGKRSVYSDFGRAVWCSFPSSDFGWPEQGHPEPLTPGIWTTDRQRAAGYNPGSAARGDAAGDYTNSFGGTSSACPGAAGVVALMLSVNPELTAGQVRKLLQQSCDRVDPQGGAYDADGHSHFYGFGRVNAEKAVLLARPRPHERLLLSRSLDRRLADGGTLQLTFMLGDSEPIESVALVLDAQHGNPADLTVTLEPPSAAPITLHPLPDRGSSVLPTRFDQATVAALAAVAGAAAAGSWVVTLADHGVGNAGSVHACSLEFALAGPTAAPRRRSPRPKSPAIAEKGRGRPRRRRPAGEAEAPAVIAAAPPV